MVDYYDPATISALGGNLLSSVQDPNIAKGLYSPVNISYHGTSPGSAANIASQGFKSGYPGWAGSSKIYSSPSADVYKHYGPSRIGMVTPESTRLPFGGGISKHGVTLSTAGESAMGVEKANKARLLYDRLRSGIYSNSATARRLLNTGKTYTGGIGNFLSKFKGAGNILGKIGMYPILADVFAGPTDEGFRTTKAYVDPIKKLANVVKNITTGGGGDGRNVVVNRPSGDGGRREAIAGGAAGASAPSRPSGYAAVRKYGRYRGGLTGYNRGGIVSLL